jgi:hypothetical protein
VTSLASDLKPPVVPHRELGTRRIGRRIEPDHTAPFANFLGGELIIARHLNISAPAAIPLPERMPIARVKAVESKFYVQRSWVLRYEAGARQDSTKRARRQNPGEANRRPFGGHG